MGRKEKLSSWPGIFRVPGACGCPGRNGESVMLERDLAGTRTRCAAGLRIQTRDKVVGPH